MVVKEIYKNSLINEYNIKITDNVKIDLWNITKHNTFVFIDSDLYNSFSNDIKKEIKCIGSNETRDMSVDEMLNEDLMFALFTGDDNIGILETVSLIEKYVKSSIHYLIVYKDK